MTIKIFDLGYSKEWGNKISKHLATELTAVELIEFDDGEQTTRPLDSVRDAHCFVIQSLHDEPTQSIDDKLCRLLFFIGALKDASAQSITVIIPYLAYARKDRRTQPRDPLTLRYLAQLIEAMGANRVMTIDVHNLAAFQNAFRIPTQHLEAQALFATYYDSIYKDDEMVIVSPDSGGLKRAEQFRGLLSCKLSRDIETAFVNKNRDRGVVSGGQDIIGNVTGRSALIIDDMVSTGQTIQLAVNALSNHGVKRIIVFATHGLFVGDANKVIADPRIEKIFISNTIPPFRVEKPLLDKITIFDATPLFAKTIQAIYEGKSIQSLLAR